jgi:hypothetical protein
LIAVMMKEEGIDQFPYSLTMDKVPLYVSGRPVKTFIAAWVAYTGAHGPIWLWRRYCNCLTRGR